MIEEFVVAERPPFLFEKWNYWLAAGPRQPSSIQSNFQFSFISLAAFRCPALPPLGAASFHSLILFDCFGLPPRRKQKKSISFHLRSLSYLLFEKQPIFLSLSQQSSFINKEREKKTKERRLAGSGAS